MHVIFDGKIENSNQALFHAICFIFSVGIGEGLSLFELFEKENLLQTEIKKEFLLILIDDMHRIEEK